MIFQECVRDKEMCYFYLLYYTEGDEILPTSFCSSHHKPSYSWENDERLKESIGHMPTNVNYAPGEMNMQVSDQCAFNQKHNTYKQTVSGLPV